MRPTLAVLLLAACFDPSYQVGLPCGPDDFCPGGQECRAGVCVLPGGADAAASDGPVVDAGLVDAGSDDGAVDAGDPDVAASCGDGSVDSGEACDDGNFTGGDGCTNCTIDGGYVCPTEGATCTPASFLFSAGTRDGAIGGRSAADSFCASKASTALGYSPGVVKAFLSINAVDTINDFVPFTRPVYTAQGVFLATNKSDLLDGSIAVSLAAAGLLPVGDQFWSGSTDNGVLSTSNCNGFNTSAGVTSVIGKADLAGSGWLGGSSVSCTSTSIHVLCLGWN